MSPHALGHVLRRSMRSLWENLGLNAIAALVIGTALLLVGVTITAQHNLDALVATWGQDVHISAWLEPDLSDEARAALEAELRALPEVRELRYVSETEAAAWLSERVDGIGPVLEELGPDALPASFEIALQPELALDPAGVEAFADTLARPGIAELDYGAAWFERFRAFLSLLRVLGGALGLIILGTAAFVVLNTVHLIVYSRRDEVEIQKLVGGTAGFIVAPFAIEGLVQGAVGALLALGGLSVVHGLLAARLQEILGPLAETTTLVLPAGPLAALGLAGALLGVLASSLAAWRFLRRAP